MSSKVEELLRSGRNEELWQLCCGFIDLKLEQFMHVQKSLLLEQLELLKKCELGKRLLGGSIPSTVEEFRRKVPLTSYIDYCPDLLEKREDVLPARPIQWIQTLGKPGEYPFKNVPITERFWEEAGLDFSAVAIFSSCRHKGEIAIKKGMKSLYAASGLPYLTSAVARRLAEDIDLQFLPDLDEAEGLPFELRVEKGFKMALSEGMDFFFGVAGVLIAIGKRFTQRSSNSSNTKLITHPGALTRLIKGLIRSWRAGRPLMPKDLWSLDVIVSMGTDSLVYKDKIQELWGRKPLNVYGNTESTIVSTQTWDYKDMVFFPNLNFLEFIPQEESMKMQLNRSYRPKTVLLDEVRPGGLYQLVVTNFHGGALVRYQTGELIRITSLRNDTLGIEIPQMINEGRVDDLIDLSFIRLNERIIWQALENTGVPYREWTACKEIGDNPRLHLYIELANGFHITQQDLADRLYKAIKKLDDGMYVYSEIESIEDLIDFKPITVTILPEGVFSGFKKMRQEQGAALTELKPPHVNPSETDLILLRADKVSIQYRYNEVLLKNN